MQIQDFCLLTQKQLEIVKQESKVYPLTPRSQQIHPIRFNVNKTPTAPQMDNNLYRRIVQYSIEIAGRHSLP